MEQIGNQNFVWKIFFNLRTPQHCGDI